MNMTPFKLAASKVLDKSINLFNNATYEMIDSGLLEEVIVRCKKGKIIFFYAPPEFHVEILICLTDEKEYDFASLMSISAVATWVKENKLQLDNYDNKIVAEFNWFVNLLVQLKRVNDFRPLFA